MATASLLDQVLEVSQDYLGPATERFLNRQIRTHLNKPPKKLTPQDLKKLIDWLKISFALLTDNTKLVDEYARRLALVADGHADKALGERWMHG